MSPRYLSAERLIAAAGASFACGEDDAPSVRAAGDEGVLRRLLDRLRHLLRTERLTAG